MADACWGNGRDDDREALAERYRDEEWARMEREVRDDDGSEEAGPRGRDR